MSSEGVKSDPLSLKTIHDSSTNHSHTLDKRFQQLHRPIHPDVCILFGTVFVNSAILCHLTLSWKWKWFDVWLAHDSFEIHGLLVNVIFSYIFYIQGKKIIYSSFKLINRKYEFNSDVYF